MNATQQANAARYAELVAELGRLIVTTHGEESAWSEDTLDMVHIDIDEAVNDALAVPAW